MEIISTLVKKIQYGWSHYIRLDLANRSASLAFYTLISVFPLILLVVTIAGTFSSDILVKETRSLVTEFFPYQSPLITSNLESLFQHRGAFGWLGGVALFFSSSMLYVSLADTVNELLETKTRRFLQNRLFFLLWLLGIVFVLFVPFIMQFIRESLALAGLGFDWLVLIYSRGGFLITAFLMFLLVIHTVPTRRISWRRGTVGAIAFALSLEMGKLGFSWFAAKNLHRYNIIYGSLGSLVLGALWIFYFYHMFLSLIYWTGHEPKLENRG